MISADEADEYSSEVASVLNDEKTYIVYLRGNGSFLHPPWQSFNHVNLAKHAVHFWHLRQMRNELPDTVDYCTAPVLV